MLALKTLVNFISVSVVMYLLAMNPYSHHIVHIPSNSNELSMVKLAYLCLDNKISYVFNTE